MDFLGNYISHIYFLKVFGLNLYDIFGAASVFRGWQQDLILLFFDSFAERDLVMTYLPNT